MLLCCICYHSYLHPSCGVTVSAVESIPLLPREETSKKNYALRKLAGEVGVGTSWPENEPFCFFFFLERSLGHTHKKKD